ncbi:MAG: DUF1549 domain-containing protein [Pirellulaceae bacterium]|nr:DUF1549 domain-containing protein [Pirellulaceae bacterium]
MIPLPKLTLIVLAATYFSVSLAAQESRDWPGSSDRLTQVSEINRQIKEYWDAYEIKPAKPAKDSEWCRRVYLDLIGRIPTVDELQDFLSSDSQDRYSNLVNKLLDDDQYTEEFSRNWTTLWTNLLIGRTGGNANNSMIDRRGMQKYLRDSFARNKPYDRMVYELVTATGNVSPEADEFNGAVNFLIDKVNGDNAAQATAATSRIFLGLQVQCTQCHNHPFNKWEQQKYWEMNAFFRQVRARGGRRAQMNGQTAELLDVDFMGESNDVQEADLYYDQRNGELKVAFPVFVDGTEISKHGAVADTVRRKELADLMMDSEYLEKALVNRVWGHFMGYGFTRPVDDLGPHNKPSHPELLDYLAAQFRQNDFAVRDLIRWIVLSRPYGLSSKTEKGKSEETRSVDDPQAGSTPLFSRFYLRQMRAEELYESLIAATRAQESTGSYEQQEQRKNRWLQQFAQAFGTDEGDETTNFAGTIPQVLMMFNGELIRQATGSANGNFLDRLVNETSMNNKEKINYLFMAGLGREAKPDELKMASQLYTSRGNPRETFQDLWWVILNSNEFIFNH